MNTGIDSRPRVLIVDDENVNIAVMADTLAQDYALSVALDGAEALDVAAKSPPPDLILLDVMMPKMSGFEVCEALKRDPALSGIPVIFVTAMDDETNEEKGLSLGAVDYIYKPINPAVVRVRVRTQLNLKLQQEFLQKLLDQRTRDLDEARTQARLLLAQA